MLAYGGRYVYSCMGVLLDRSTALSVCGRLPREGKNSQACFINRAAVFYFSSGIISECTILE